MNAEVHPSGAFAARGRDDPDDASIEEDPGRDLSAAQQALQPALRRCFETASLEDHVVQGSPRLQHLDQQLPRGPAFGWIPLPYGKVGTEGLAVFRKRELQLLGNRSGIRAGIPLWREAPTQHAPGEFLEIGQKRLRLAVWAGITLLDAVLEQFLAFDIPPVQDRTRLYERVGGHNQPGRLNEPEPFQVVPDLWRELLGHSRHPVSGHR